MSLDDYVCTAIDYEVDVPQFDIFEYIKYRVFEMNESWDVFIFGMKGISKSTVGYAVASLLDDNFGMSKWAFMTEQWAAISERCKRGDVIVFDEQGTQESGSSYDFRSRENKAYADEVQLNRTDGVINIGISLGAMRVINRVRNQYKVFIHPDEKLSSSRTGGLGLYTRCTIKYSTEIAFADTGSDEVSKYVKRNFCDFQGRQIDEVWLPHPSLPDWTEYSKQRSAFRELVRENMTRKELSGMPAIAEKGSYADQINKLQEMHREKPAIAPKGNLNVDQSVDRSSGQTMDSKDIMKVSKSGVKKSIKSNAAATKKKAVARKVA